MNDDVLEEFGGDVLFDLDAAYDWLVRKAHEVGDVVTPDRKAAPDHAEEAT